MAVATRSTLSRRLHSGALGSASVRMIYDERFCRMWEFYLASSEAAFRWQDLMVFQLQLALATTRCRSHATTSANAKKRWQSTRLPIASRCGKTRRRGGSARSLIERIAGPEACLNLELTTFPLCVPVLFNSLGRSFESIWSQARSTVFLLMQAVFAHPECMSVNRVDDRGGCGLPGCLDGLHQGLVACRDKSFLFSPG